MKKALFSFLLLVVSVLSIAAITGCEEQKTPVHEHSVASEWKKDETQHWHECTECQEKVDVSSHVYDQQVKSSEYLKSDATCDQPKTYYKSCICGAKGTETFTDGEALGHTYPLPTDTNGIEWVWSEDNKSATLKLTCQKNGCSFILDLEAVVGEVVIDESDTPLCVEAGSGKVTATVSYGGNTYTNTKDVVIAKSEHTLVDVTSPATCEHGGYSECYQCCACDAYFKKSAEGTVTVAGEKYVQVNKEDCAIEKLPHAHVSLVEGQSNVCQDGWKSYYTCADCGLFFEDEACEHEIEDLDAWKTNVGKLDAVHTYEENGLECTLCHQGRVLNPSDFVQVLNDYKGDYVITFSMHTVREEMQEADFTDFTAYCNASGNSALKITYATPERYGQAAKDNAIDATAIWGSYNMPGRLISRTDGKAAYFGDGDFTTEVTITRVGSYLTMDFINHGSEAAIDHHYCYLLDESLNSTVKFEAINSTVTISDYKFVPTVCEYKQLLTEDVTIAKSGKSAVDASTDRSLLNELPEDAQGASFEYADLKVGEMLVLEFTNKRTTSDGNNNWWNYFVYLYDSTTNAHLAADNLVARDRQNGFDSWKSGVYQHGAGVDASWFAQEGSTANNNAMLDAKVVVRVQRISESIVLISSQNCSNEYAGYFVGSFNVSTLAPEATKFGVALATRSADIVLSSAKVFSTVHSIEKIEGVAKTCETDGYKEYYHCTICDKYFEDTECSKEISDVEAWKLADGKLAGGHELGNIEYDENNHWRTCSVCEQKVGVEAHTFDQEVKADEYVKTIADCETAGEYYKSCTCGYKGSETFVSDQPAGHSYPANDASEGIEWVWKEDNTTATLKLSCQREGCKHVEEVTAEVSAMVVTPLNKKDCVDGKGTYTATATFNEVVYTGTKVIDLNATVEHTLVAMKKDVSCTEDGYIDSYKCSTCGKWFVKDAEGVIVVGEEKYTEKTQAECTITTEGHDLDENHVCSKCGKTVYYAGESYTQLSQYVGDFEITFTAEYLATSYNHGEVQFVLGTEEDKEKRPDNANVKLLWMSTVGRDYNWPASLVKEACKYQSRGFYTGNVIVNYSIKRIGNYIEVKANIKPADANTKFTAGTDVTTAPDPSVGLNNYLYVTFDGSITSNVVFYVSGGNGSKEAYVSNYTFTPIEKNDEVLVDYASKITIEKSNAAESADRAVLNELPESGTASFEYANLKVGESLQLVFENTSLYNEGNNNWRNYFLYIYDASKNDGHIGASNILARDRGNSFDVWINGVYNHDRVGAKDYQFWQRHDQLSEYNDNNQSGVVVYATVTRVSEDLLYITTISYINNTNNMRNSFSVPLNVVQDGGVSNVGVALLTRTASVVLTSAIVRKQIVHEFVKTEAVAKTCTTDGVKEYYYCTACKKYYETESHDNVISDLESWKISDGKIPMSHEYNGTNPFVCSAEGCECAYRDVTENVELVRNEKESFVITMTFEGITRKGTKTNFGDQVWDDIMFEINGVTSTSYGRAVALPNWGSYNQGGGRIVQGTDTQEHFQKYYNNTPYNASVTITRLGGCFTFVWKFVYADEVEVTTTQQVMYTTGDYKLVFSPNGCSAVRVTNYTITKGSSSDLEVPEEALWTYATNSQDQNLVEANYNDNGNAGFEVSNIEVGTCLTVNFHNVRIASGDNNWQNFMAYFYNADENEHLIGGLGEANKENSTTNALVRYRGNGASIWTNGVHTHNGLGIFSCGAGGDFYNNGMSNADVCIQVSRIAEDLVGVTALITCEGAYIKTVSFSFKPSTYHTGGVTNLGFALTSRGATITITSAYVSALPLKNN